MIKLTPPEISSKRMSLRCETINIIIITRARTNRPQTLIGHKRSVFAWKVHKFSHIQYKAVGRGTGLNDITLSFRSFAISAHNNNNKIVKCEKIFPSSIIAAHTVMQIRSSRFLSFSIEHNVLNF